MVMGQGTESRMNRVKARRDIEQKYTWYMKDVDRGKGKVEEVAEARETRRLYLASEELHYNRSPLLL